MQDFRWLKELWQGRRFLGPVVERPTAVPATGNLFTVVTGRVIMTSIVGQITTVCNAVPTAIRLLFTPTTGTAIDIADALDISGYANGNLLGITGIPGDTMTPPVNAGSIPAQTVGVVLKPGILSLVLAAGGTTGSVRWTLHYIQVDAAATVIVSP